MSKEELYVGDAKHKADIKFSEKGIKAAAVTVIMMLEKSAFEEPKEIVELNFNKPFMFIIRDKNTKDVWFTGTVYEPVLWDEVKDDYKQR
jgi:serpin B